MKDVKTTIAENAKAEAVQHAEAQVSAKKAWRAPRLQTYGAVAVLTQSVGSGSGDMGTMMTSSDINAKQDIVRIGTHPLGMGLYLFNYKSEFRTQWGQGRQFGVMAQEVEQIMPHAVITGADGYKQVNYALLGMHVHH